MTFKQFKNMVESQRKDVIVSKHGDYCENKSKNTLGIIFINKDGRQSRVYSYSGTYADILTRLDIKFAIKSDIINLERRLQHYKEINHKEEDLFSFDDETIDFDDEIKQIEKRIKELYTYPLIEC